MTSICNSIETFAKQMFPWAALLFPLYLLGRGGTLLWRKKKGAAVCSLKQELLLCGFALYLLCVLAVTVLPEISPNSFQLYYPGGGFGVHNIAAGYINVIPGNIFRHMSLSFAQYGGMTLWISMLGNIALFVPFGVLCPLCFDFGLKQTLWSSVCFSLSIELFQLFLPRMTDIDDLLLNLLGALLGYLLYFYTAVFVYTMRANKRKKRKLPKYKLTKEGS